MVANKRRGKKRVPIFDFYGLLSGVRVKTRAAIQLEMPFKPVSSKVEHKSVDS